MESGNSQQSYTSEPKHALKRPKPVKKVVKSNQQQNPNQSRSFSDRSSSGAGRQLASPPPARSPQVKQPKLDDSHNIVTHSNLDNSLLAPILPKQEPLDTSEFYSEIGYDEHMDVASMLDTTLGESSRTLSFTSKGPPDASSPGKLTCFYAAVLTSVVVTSIFCLHIYLYVGCCRYIQCIRLLCLVVMKRSLLGPVLGIYYTR